MPIYEYECTLCSHHFERLRRWSEACYVDICPSCYARANKTPSVPIVRERVSGGQLAPIEQESKRRVSRASLVDWKHYKESKRNSRERREAEARDTAKKKEKA